MDSQRWDGFELRDDDIVISTPPKSGTTWMQMQCALLVFQDPALPCPLTRLSPWLDTLTESAESMYATYAAQSHRRFIKTHTPYDGLPHDPRVTYVVVGRDPRDVAISWDHHWANMNLPVILELRAEAVGLDDLAEFMAEGPPELSPDPKVRFWEWMEQPPADDPRGLAGVLHHLQTFWDRRDDGNVVLFHYADMKADLDGEMRRLAAAVHIDVDEDRWPALVEAATFDRMRDRAEELAPQAPNKYWNDTDGFFYSGTSGQWLSFFDDGDEARYAALVDAVAPPDLAAWVHRGSISLDA
jgi:hypothetical protein